MSVNIQNQYSKVELEMEMSLHPATYTHTHSNRDTDRDRDRERYRYSYLRSHSDPYSYLCPSPSYGNDANGDIDYFNVNHHNKEEDLSYSTYRKHYRNI